VFWSGRQVLSGGESLPPHALRIHSIRRSALLARDTRLVRQDPSFMSACRWLNAAVVVNGLAFLERVTGSARYRPVSVLLLRVLSPLTSCSTCFDLGQPNLIAARDDVCYVFWAAACMPRP